MPVSEFPLFTVSVCCTCLKSGEKYQRAHGIFMGECARCFGEIDEFEVRFVRPEGHKKNGPTAPP